jgi:hypothetical protein
LQTTEALFSTAAASHEPHTLQVLMLDVADVSGAKKASGYSLPFAGPGHMVHYLTKFTWTRSDD